MKTRMLFPLFAIALVALAGVFVLLQGEPASQAERVEADVVVYKSPTCGCCNGWVDHMRDSGFTVATVDIPTYQALQARKRELGVPADLGSCHTAVVDGRVVEGHVPARLVRRMLAEEGTEGIAAPGMPIGSPGMEGPGATAYDVIAFRKDGSRSVYETVDPAQESVTR